MHVLALALSWPWHAFPAHACPWHAIPAHACLPQEYYHPPIYTFCTKSKVTGTDINFLMTHNFRRQARRQATLSGRRAGNKGSVLGNMP